MFWIKLFSLQLHDSPNVGLQGAVLERSLLLRTHCGNLELGGLDQPVAREHRLAFARDRNKRHQKGIEEDRRDLNVHGRMKRFK